MAALDHGFALVNFGVRRGFSENGLRETAISGALYELRYLGERPLTRKLERDRTQQGECRRATEPVAMIGSMSAATFVPMLDQGVRVAEPLDGHPDKLTHGRDANAKWDDLMSQRAGASSIRFAAAPYTIGKSTILRLPERASLRLPSRGQVAVHGTINGRQFRTVLEPDGNSGHWLRLDRKLETNASLRPGRRATVEVEVVKEWPEPTVPPDLKAALAVAPRTIQELWREITPMARWEWVRWVNGTPNPDTRRRRVEVTISKMHSGKRRPCCFNLAACTDPDLAKNGRLPEPSS